MLIAIIGGISDELNERLKWWWWRTLFAARNNASPTDAAAKEKWWQGLGADRRQHYRYTYRAIDAYGPTKQRGRIAPAEPTLEDVAWWDSRTPSRRNQMRNNFRQLDDPGIAFARIFKDQTLPAAAAASSLIPGGQVASTAPAVAQTLEKARQAQQLAQRINPAAAMSAIANLDKPERIAALVPGAEPIAQKIEKARAAASAAQRLTARAQRGDQQATRALEALQKTPAGRKLQINATAAVLELLRGVSSGDPAAVAKAAEIMRRARAGDSDAQNTRALIMAAAAQQRAVAQAAARAAQAVRR